jgi:predicted dehydrogenase
MIGNKIRKIYRFFKIYGFGRTYIKVLGRTRLDPLIKFPISPFFKSTKQVAIIGAGQFAFATLAFYLKKNQGNCIVGVYDINQENSSSFAKYHNTKVFLNSSELINSSEVKIVYIASNHSTHTDYAIEALQADKIVYVEKPISVTKEQFSRLMEASENKKLYVGYNRPMSPAIAEIRNNLNVKPRAPLTLNCFITGHKLDKEHWYRNLNEGTRVCGNIGHWLDLSINLLNVIGLPKRINVTINSSNAEEKDDNVAITMVTDKEDLICIILSSRAEPFEGINETINIQHSNVIAKIDDFRRLTIWNGAAIIKKRYFRKNVGHENAILQPFAKLYERDFDEIKISTRLMLEITEAIRSNNTNFVFEV